jgi:tetratricopeptide (TPR) repeat protein
LRGAAVIWLLLVWLWQGDAAKEAMLRGRYAEAARLYQQMVKATPGEPLLRFNLGLAQYSAKQYAGAVASFQSFLKSQPAHPQANLLAASSLVKLEKACEALPYLKRAEALAASAEYLSVAGPAQLECLDYAGAAKSFAAWARLEPLNTRAWYGLGKARVELQDEEGAREAFARLSSLPYSAELRQLELEIARGLAKQKRVPEAREAYARILAYDASDAEALFELGGLQETAEAALPHYEKAVAARADFWIAQAALGRALLSLGRGAEAVGPLEKAAANLNEKSVWAALANAYRAAGRDADARRALLRAR